MVKSGKVEGLDNVLLALFGASFAIPALISVYGLDIRLMAIPSICYGFWILIIGYFNPKVLFSDFPERSQVERMRGWAYVIGLPICLVLNFLFGFVLPKDFSTLFLGSFLVASLLGIAVAGITRSMFKKEIAKMDKAQYILAGEMLSLAGRSMIYSSMALLYLTMSIIWIDYSPLYVVGFSIFSLVLLVVSYDRHRKSSKCANDLADSLKGDKRLKKKR
jgi:hypothetical protein